MSVYLILYVQHQDQDYEYTGHGFFYFVTLNQSSKSFSRTGYSQCDRQDFISYVFVFFLACWDSN